VSERRLVKKGLMRGAPGERCFSQLSPGCGAPSPTATPGASFPACQGFCHLLGPPSVPQTRGCICRAALKGSTTSRTTRTPVVWSSLRSRVRATGSRSYCEVIQW